MTSFVQLPVEIIIMIFKYFSNADIFYSFKGINEKLDTILKDPIFTRNLTLIKSFDGLSCQFTDVI
ncbi:unnamed protein product, partial [Rotaria sp. Silwood2]